MGEARFKSVRSTQARNERRRAYLPFPSKKDLLERVKVAVEEEEEEVEQAGRVEARERGHQQQHREDPVERPQRAHWCVQLMLAS